MADRLEIRAMTKEDIEAVLDIERRAFRNPWSQRSFEEALGTESYALVARSDDIVVGYSVGWIREKEMHIVNLAVREDFRRRGIASALLRELLKTAHRMSLDRATLEVRMSNAAAIALYESHGFRKIALDRGYYLSPPEDAVIMMKDLRDDNHTGGGSRSFPGPARRGHDAFRHRPRLRSGRLR